MMQVSYEGSDIWTLRFDDDILNDGDIILSTDQIHEIIQEGPTFLGYKCKTKGLDVPQTDNKTKSSD